MRLLVINILLFTAICLSKVSFGQHDSSLLVLSELPNKYFKEVDKKIDQYSNRITGKTEKTLIKLSRWEKKIQVALEKVNPAAAQRLFGPGRTTFSSMLAKYQSGTEIVEKSKARYDSYRDKLTTSLKYIEAKKTYLDSSILKPLIQASKKAENLELDIANTEAIEKFVKERKKELINETIKYLGKNKYLSKINKESYYYIETLRNYKELFKDPSKAEETAVKLLHEIPGFDKFLKQNGMIASLFGNGGIGNTQDIAGLQTSSSLSSMIQSKISAGGPNAQQVFAEKMKNVQNEISQLKEKVAKQGGFTGSTEIPDFKPNPQKSKTFFQRLEFGVNLQTQKSSAYFPATTTLAGTVGYKLNSSGIIGFGFSYRLGLGDWNKIKVTHEGVGFRSFIDWKLKGKLYISGGYEMQYNDVINSLAALKTQSNWQMSGLIGVTKKYSIGKMKKGNLQILIDFLSQTHLPKTSMIIFRTGVNF